MCIDSAILASCRQKPALRGDLRQLVPINKYDFFPRICEGTILGGGGGCALGEVFGVLPTQCVSITVLRLLYIRNRTISQLYCVWVVSKHYSSYKIYTQGEGTILLSNEKCIKPKSQIQQLILIKHYTPKGGQNLTLYRVP